MDPVGGLLDTGGGLPFFVGDLTPEQNLQLSTIGGDFFFVFSG